MVTCPHCQGELDSNRFTDISPNGIPGRFCYLCNMPLDELALKNTHNNYGNESCRREFMEKMTERVMSFLNPPLPEN